MREGLSRLPDEERERFIPHPRDLERTRRRSRLERQAGADVPQRAELTTRKTKPRKRDVNVNRRDEQYDFGVLEQRRLSGDLAEGSDDHRRYIELQAKLGTELSTLVPEVVNEPQGQYKDTPRTAPSISEVQATGQSAAEYLQTLSDKDFRAEFDRTRFHSEQGHSDAQRALKDFYAELKRRRAEQPAVVSLQPVPKPPAGQAPEETQALHGPEEPAVVLSERVQAQPSKMSQEEFERYESEALGHSSLLTDEGDAWVRQEQSKPVEPHVNVSVAAPSAETGTKAFSTATKTTERFHDPGVATAPEPESKPLRTQYEIVKERLDVEEVAAMEREEQTVKEAEAQEKAEAARLAAEAAKRTEPSQQLSESAPPAEKPKRQWRAGVVEIQEKVEDIARHKAEERLQAELRGESPEGKRPGWLKRLVLKTSRHWGEEGYRQKYIAEERRRIMSQIEGLDANIFAPDEKTTEAHRKERDAIVGRFLEGLTREREGERQESLAEGETKTKIRELMSGYVNGEVDEATFVQQKAQLLTGLQTENQTLFEKNGAMIDNLLDVAREIRSTMQHGERMAAADLDVDISLGKYRSAIKDQAHLRAFDRLVKNIQKVPVLGKMVNPAVLGFTVSLATKPLLSGIRGLAKYSDLGALGAGTLVGAGYAGFRRAAEVESDIAHTRRGAAMGHEIPKGAKRLEKMKEFTYDTVRASNLTDNLKSSVTALEGLDLNDRGSMQRVQETLQAIAAIEARLDSAHATQHDYMAFDDPTTIERQRFDMLKTVAEAKVRVQSIFPDIARASGDSSTVEDYLKLHHESHEHALLDRVENVDRRFKAFKRKEVAKAAAYGAVTGLVAGSVGQLAYTKILEAMHRPNVPESALEHLWDKITGRQPLEDPGKWHSYSVGDHVLNDGSSLHDGHGRLVLPEGMRAINTPGKDGFITLLDERSGHPIHEPFTMTPDGHLPEDVRHDLLRDGIRIGERDISEVISGKQNFAVDEWMEKHARGTTRVARDLWYDQNTPKVFDKNELRLQWGGINGTGLDEQGNYILSASRMTPDGSFHRDFSADARALFGRGDLHALLSASHDTEKLPYDFQFNEHGDVIIPKDSEAAKLLFRMEGGKALFLGRFAEASEFLRDKHGNLIVNEKSEQVIRMLATHEGKGITGVTADKLMNERHITDFLRPRDWELPPTIPQSRRKPLEGFSRKQGDQEVPPYYSYSSESVRREFAERLSDTLKKNPDAQLDGRAEVSKYLENLDPVYRAELEAFNDSINDPMAKETRLVIMIPAFQEAKNIQKSLEQYASQTTVDGKPADPKTFEIIVFVNRPEHVPDDGTVAQIAEFKTKHPEMRVQAISKVFPSDEVSIGRYRKYIGDLALLRSQRRKQRDGSLMLVSNDADMDHVAPTYVDRMVRDFDQHPKVDAYAGKIDFAEGEVYEKYPLFLGVQRAMQYLDRGLRGKDYRARPRTLGNNTAVRAEMYAAVGGYITSATLAEDLQIGEMIEQARRGTTRESIKYENRAEIVVNPRRHVAKLKEGIPLVAMYDDWARNETIRNKNWQKLVEGDTETISKPRLENELSLLYEWMQREVGGRRVKDLSALFDRAMRFLGMRYELYETMEPNREGKMEQKTKVRILSTSRFNKSLAEYPERYKKVRTAKEQREQRRPGRPKTVSEEPRDEVSEARVATAEQVSEETRVARPVEATGGDDVVTELATATPAAEAVAGSGRVPAQANSRTGARTERAGEASASTERAESETTEAEVGEVDPKILRSALINQGVPEATLRVVNDETLVRGFQDLIRNNGYQNADVIRQVLARDFNTPRLATAFVKNEDLLRRMAEVRRLVLTGKNVEAKAKRAPIERRVNISPFETETTSTTGTQDDGRKGDDEQAAES